VRINNKHIVDCLLAALFGSDCLRNTFSQSVEEIITALPNADILIVGDYNLPHIIWHNKNNFLQVNVDCSGWLSKQANTVLHFFNEFNFRQHNSIVNVDRNTLDLVFFLSERYFSIVGC